MCVGTWRRRHGKLLYATLGRVALILALASTLTVTLVLSPATLGSVALILALTLALGLALTLALALAREQATNGCPSAPSTTRHMPLDGCSTHGRWISRRFAPGSSSSTLWQVCLQRC